MKRRTILTFLAAFLLVPFLNAQDASTKEIKLEDLQVPNSPAFILLDVAPTAIEKPATAKAFTTSILNSVAENNGIPQNYGLEFTPFWFIKHPNFNAFKYYGIHYEAKGKSTRRVFAGLRMAGVSFALVNNKESKDSMLVKTSNLSLGLRSTILKVISNQDLRDIVRNNDSLIARLGKATRDRGKIDAKLDIVKDSLSVVNKRIDTETDTSKLRALIAEKRKLVKRSIILAAESDDLLNNTSVDTSIIRFENTIKEILARKPLFAVDGAVALNWAFDNSNFKSNYFDRFGAWLTMDLSLPLSKKNAAEKKNYINLYVVGRYLSGRSLDETDSLVRQDVLDSGGKIELEIARFSLSGEYLYRLNMTNSAQNSFRASAMVKFKIMESLYITGAYGKNFGDKNNVIAQVGINWGFGSGLEYVVAGKK
ncbi:MAG: hypothetical protein NTW10_00295 [Bacteroidetes bacterium]|nr:hypothetical protein [Bacteroidota bacterium]